MHLHSEVTVLLDDTKAYDEALHGKDMRVLQDLGDVRIITKHDAMQNGKAACLITFTVDIAGKPARAQTVISLRLFKILVKVLNLKYDDEGMPIPVGEM
jgi:hypothetical protein